MPAPPGGPASLLASLPATIGRQPGVASELILVGWTPADEEHVAFVTLPLADAEPRSEVDAVRRLVIDGAEDAVAIVYTTRQPAGEAILRFVGAVAARYGLGLLDAVLVVDGYWRSITCSDPACCPPAGTPVPTPTEETL